MIKAENRFKIALFLILVFNVEYLSSQGVVSLTAEKSKVEVVIHKQGDYSCIYSPPGADIVLVQWFYSTLADPGTRERVYQYNTLPPEDSARGRLDGKATHTINRTEGRITLHIQNTNYTRDNGMFYCRLQGLNQAFNAQMESYITTDALEPGYNESWHNITDAVLKNGSTYVAAAWHVCNDPGVKFMWTMNKQDENITFENGDRCTEDRLNDSTSIIEFDVTTDITLSLTKFHPSFIGGKQQVPEIGIISVKQERGTSTPSPPPKIRTTPAPGLRPMALQGCVEKTTQTAVTVVAVLILLTGTCVLIMSACVCQMSQDGEIDKEDKSEPKHEVERMNMTVDNNVASQGSTNRTEEDELYESCIRCCPCCTCCKWCLQRCSCCKWFPMKCKLCACTCTCRCPCRCPWCLSRLFGIACGSFAIIIAVITLIVIQTRTVCQTDVINSTTTYTPY